MRCTIAAGAGARPTLTSCRFQAGNPAWRAVGTPEAAVRSMIASA